MMKLEPGNYRPTQEDRLWLLRAVEGEGPPERLVAQALVNRFVWLYQRPPPPYDTLAEFVQAYSQPVNPRWVRGGDKFEAAWKAAQTDGRRRQLQAQHERRQRHRSKMLFRPEVVDAVDRALMQGPVDLPSGDTTDFAARGVKVGPQFELRKEAPNTFYAVRGGEWGGYGVAERRVMAGAGAVGLVVVGVLVLSGRGKT